MKFVIKLFPLLGLYVATILIVSKPVFVADEGSYVAAAVRMSQGDYSSRDNVRLWWGPGYPLVLVPFVLVKSPWIAAKLLNGFFLFGAVLFFGFTLRGYLPERPALYSAYLFGVYPPFLRQSYVLMSEPLALFLMCGFVFFFCKRLRSEKTVGWTLAAAAAFLASLALTRVFFGSVITAGLVVSLFFSPGKKRIGLRKIGLVCGLALVFCLPYLVYTYSQTHKVFYWGTSGGMSLYTMSTPYPGEYGDWFGEALITNKESLARNHGDFFERISHLGVVQRDDEFKRQAFRNIARHPAKFGLNWIANIGRLLFQYPYSYTPQSLSAYLYAAPNMFLVTFALLCIYPSYRGRRLVPPEIWALLLLALIAFGGSSVLSAYARHFYVLVPILALWIIFVLNRVLQIRIRSDTILDPGRSVHYDGARKAKNGPWIKFRPEKK